MTKTPDDILEIIQKEIEQKRENHKELMASPKFVQAEGYFDSVTNDFITALQSVAIYSTRDPESREKLLIARGVEEFVESILVIRLALKEGALNPPRRELRYMLEMAIKYYFVDSNMVGSSYEDRIQFLNDHVPKSSIEPIDEIKLFGFSKDQTKAFTDDVNAIYANLCRFVHPSKYQLDEYLGRSNRGATLGFESDKEVRATGTLLFRVLDILLVLIFQGFGMALTGDLFIHMLDDIEKWKFHKGKHCIVVSSFYNYKLERNNRGI